MKRQRLEALVSAAGCSMEVNDLDVGFETLVQAPCGSAFNNGLHELVVEFYSDRAAMYAEAAEMLAGHLPLAECQLDCEWCYAPQEDGSDV